MTQAVNELVSRILAEGAMPLADVRPRFRSNRRAGAIGHQALYRWALKGLPCPDGSRVYLETIRIAGKLCTSWQAVERFIARQQDTSVPAAAPAPLPSRTSTRRERESEQAAGELAAAGI
jgi:hypothetical protein